MNKNGELKEGSPCEACGNPSMIIFNGAALCQSHYDHAKKVSEESGNTKSAEFFNPHLKDIAK